MLCTSISTYLCFPTLESTKICGNLYTDATDLKPLMEVVDTEALTRVLDSNSDVSAAFEYLGYTVYMDSEGKVEIE